MSILIKGMETPTNGYIIMGFRHIEPGDLREADDGEN